MHRLALRHLLTRHPEAPAGVARAVIAAALARAAVFKAAVAAALLVSFAVLLLPANAHSALPDGAQPGKSLFVSLYGIPGAGLSLDAKYWEAFGVGASFTGGRTPVYPGHTDEGRDDEDFVFEAYANIMIASSAGPPGPRSYGVSFIGGLWVAQSVRHPLIGLCCTYRVDDRVIMRGNAVYGPSAGIEFAYILSRNIEATLTVLSGRGMLGLKFGLVEPHRVTHNVDDLAAVH